MKPDPPDSRLKQILGTGREYLTHWIIAGATITLTGFSPDHWIAAILDHLPIHAKIGLEWLPNSDIRIGLVAIGVAIIAWDVLRRSKFQKWNALQNSQIHKLDLVQTRDRSGNDQTSSIEPSSAISLDDQVVRFCIMPDGVRIAYATIGQGPPVVIVANWLTHLELDLLMPARRAIIERLTPDHQLVRYDARGNGLSDWDVNDISFEASVSDLTTVVNDLHLKSFALFGQSQGAAIAAVYAARHSETVTHLVLYGSYARGRRRRGSEGQIAESDAFIAMIREGWGKSIDAYVKMFGTFFMPDANPDQLANFTKLQRAATTPENAARIQLALDDIDITEELSRVTAPTLVLHAREDARAPFEEGRRVAATIPNARFVPLESRNHAMLAGEPALIRYMDEVEQFLKN